MSNLTLSEKWGTYMMTTIYDYCAANIAAIKIHNQNAFSWQKYNQAPLTDISHYKSCIAGIPPLIGRDDILNAFRSAKYYKGFVMAMLWGNIGLQPLRDRGGDKTTTSAYRAFSISEAEVNNRIVKIKERIDNGDLSGAYGLLEKDLKFDGIDVSFFTKILAFLSEGNSPSRDLLIYDKWTKLIHVHLLLDNGKDPQQFYSLNSIRKLYGKNNKGKLQTHLIYPLKGLEAAAYLSYVAEMKILANSINNELHSTITPFQLEGFLFGDSLKSNKEPSNPRYWVQQNFANHYLPDLLNL